MLRDQLLRRQLVLQGHLLETRHGIRCRGGGYIDQISCPLGFRQYLSELSPMIKDALLRWAKEPVCQMNGALHINEECPAGMLFVDLLRFPESTLQELLERALARTRAIERRLADQNPKGGSASLMELVELVYHANPMRPEGGIYLPTAVPNYDKSVPAWIGRLVPHYVHSLVTTSGNEGMEVGYRLELGDEMGGLVTTLGGLFYSGAAGDSASYLTIGLDARLAPDKIMLSAREFGIHWYWDTSGQREHFSVFTARATILAGRISGTLILRPDAWHEEASGPFSQNGIGVAFGLEDVGGTLYWVWRSVFK
jgi:hypothetical protein